jgi:hypothetical protein
VSIVKVGELLPFFRATVPELGSMLEALLDALGYTTYMTNKYLLGVPPADRAIPLLLVAHVDTVFDKPPRKVFFDPRERVLWSPEGLGADDRAGVAMVCSVLVKKGLFPTVLFTEGEERGALGAAAFVSELGSKEFLGNIRAIIELDRMHGTDAVFYDCDNPDFTEWVTAFGWKKGIGSFTDISLICPRTGIAGVNLSVGYHLQHTTTEHLYLDEWRASFGRLGQMLEAPPQERFVYLPLRKAFQGKKWTGPAWLGDEMDDRRYYGKYGGTFAAYNERDGKYFNDENALVAKKELPTCHYCYKDIQPGAPFIIEFGKNYHSTCWAKARYPYKGETETHLFTVPL